MLTLDENMVVLHFSLDNDPASDLLVYLNIKASEFVRYEKIHTNQFHEAIAIKIKGNSVHKLYPESGTLKIFETCSGKLQSRVNLKGKKPLHLL